MGRTRDPGGIAALKKLRETSTVGKSTFGPAIERVALIMAAKGGLVSDITPGDCMELLECSRRVFSDGTRANRHSSFFYQLLHSAGVFPASAPATVRMISTRFAGQLSAEQLVDRYDLACRPVRDLLVDYLRERQPDIDYSTLTGLATTLALWFWKDLETHHPGIDSLLLPPGRSISTSASGHWTSPPAGGRGPCPARSAAATCTASQETNVTTCCLAGRRGWSRKLGLTTRRQRDIRLWRRCRRRRKRGDRAQQRGWGSHEHRLLPRFEIRQRRHGR